MSENAAAYVAEVVVNTEEPDISTNNRLFVCNLPFSFKDEDLKKLFSKYKAVTAVISINERGSRGFGFVQFETVAMSELARSNMNGIVLEKRRVEVRRATGSNRGFMRLKQMNGESCKLRPNINNNSHKPSCYPITAGVPSLLTTSPPVLQDLVAFQNKNRNTLQSQILQPHSHLGNIGSIFSSQQTTITPTSSQNDVAEVFKNTIAQAQHYNNILAARSLPQSPVYSQPPFLGNMTVDPRTVSMNMFLGSAVPSMVSVLPQQQILSMPLVDADKIYTNNLQQIIASVIGCDAVKVSALLVAAYASDPELVRCLIAHSALINNPMSVDPHVMMSPKWPIHAQIAQNEVLRLKNLNNVGAHLQNVQTCNFPYAMNDSTPTSSHTILHNPYRQKTLHIEDTPSFDGSQSDENRGQ